MKRDLINAAVLAYFGLEVSFQSPSYAILSQGADIALGNVCEFADMYTIPVIVREDSSWVDFLRMYESYHHFLNSKDSRRLYCAFVCLPRFILAMRNNRSFAQCIINAPLNITGDHL